MKQLCLFLLKIGLSVAILAFLIYQAASTTDAEGKPIFEQLLHSEKDWASLAYGFLFCFIAVLITVLRWLWLVRMQKVPARCAEALRIGYIGYLFNLAPMGIVGGDLLKVWLLARRHKETPNAGAVILAAAFIDRMIGLYALFFMAGVAVLGMGILSDPQTSQTLYGIAIAVLIAWGAGTVAGLAVLLPKIKEKEVEGAGETKKAGGTGEAKETGGAGETGEKTETGETPEPSKLAKLFNECVYSVRMYRQFPIQLTIVVAVSILVHTCFATSIFFLTKGLWETYPTFSQQLYISPICSSTSAIPLPFGARRACPAACRSRPRARGADALHFAC